MNSVPFVLLGDIGGELEEASGELELALMVSSVEVARKRRHNPNTLFVSRLLWPFYLVKLEGTPRVVLFDGLGLFPLRINYPVIPSVDELESQLGQMRPSGLRTQTLLESLQACRQMMKRSTAVRTYRLDGPIVDRRLTAGLQHYLRTSIDDPLYGISGLLPTISSADVAYGRLRTLIQLVKGTSKSEIERLETVSNRIEDAYAGWTSYVAEQQRQTSTRYGAEITEAIASIGQTVSTYRQLMAVEIDELERRQSDAITQFHTEVSRWEEEEEQWRQLGDSHAKSQESARRAKADANKRLARAVRQRDRETQRVVVRYSGLIEREWRKVGGIERERDRHLGQLEAKQEEVGRRLSRLQSEVAGLIERKQAFLNSVDATGMDMPAHLAGYLDTWPIIIHIPLWIAALESVKGIRFVVLLPITVRPGWWLRKNLRALLGGTGLSIHPRAKTLNSLLRKRLEQALRSDKTLRDEIQKIGARRDALRDPGVRAAAESGLVNLAARGWIRSRTIENSLAYLRQATYRGPKTQEQSAPSHPV